MLQRLEDVRAFYIRAKPICEWMLEYIIVPVKLTWRSGLWEQHAHHQKLRLTLLLPSRWNQKVILGDYSANDPG